MSDHQRTAEGYARNKGGQAVDSHGFEHAVGQTKYDAPALRGGIEAVKSGASMVQDVAKQSLKAAKEKGAEAAQTVKEAGANYPLATLGVGVGIGFLIGMFVFRPRS